ncbi:MAG TPA: hypothetical protein PLP07_07560 [Pyrinomonadaceae bacterium]|nr:glycosyl hydrolase [Chloracidobacterium sp.]MBP9936763.1 hypothetical protein [Pyrinomonadaceae bacterium]MBK7801870.1 glycosyl hydrolase [Chloracidobacterium sp.]MBK9437985.1 glycosyl hydrolase [Chloracidobacterium sp.]MBK9765581.1 glycosyl hydrolase [Chloracidobacterium sp.]
MKTILSILVILLSAQFATAQWIKQTVNTTASFRGLAVVNENVVWASGTGGTVIKTLDGGKTWSVMIVPGAEKLDFRDIEAFDPNTAYILSIGNGGSSRIYKTTDGGATWNLQFTNTNSKAFFDAMACWDKNNCIAMADPVDDKFNLIETANGGKTWTQIDTGGMPAAGSGEAAFAASGTCIITHGNNNAFIVTGGGDARVFRTIDRGKTWQVADTPMVKGTSGSGIFGIAMRDAKNGVIVGGNYEKPEIAAKNQIAFTSDGGKSWYQSPEFPHGFRSAIAYLDKYHAVTVGSTGSDTSSYQLGSWLSIDKSEYNAVQTKGKKATWAVGAKGLVVRMK